MIKNKITIETIGEPNLLDLPDSELKVFLETIYSRILALISDKNF